MGTGGSLTHKVRQVPGRFYSHHGMQSDVEGAVAMLARARAFETELFLKYQGGLLLDPKETERLVDDIHQLTEVARRFERKGEQ